MQLSPKPNSNGNIQSKSRTEIANGKNKNNQPAARSTVTQKQSKVRSKSSPQDSQILHENSSIRINQVEKKHPPNRRTMPV